LIRHALPAGRAALEQDRSLDRQRDTSLDSTVMNIRARLSRVTAGRSTLIAASSIHMTNDACFALLYPLLPFIAEDLELSYTQVGLLKATFSGASSALQIPAGAVGMRFGEALVLMIGNIWVGLGLMLMALTGSFALLLGAAVVAGIGGNAQHPLAASLVSKSVPRKQMATAMGTLNFSGDLGKLLGPFIAGIIAVQYGWRAALGALGLFTAIFTVGLLLRSRNGNGQQAPADVPAGKLEVDSVQKGFNYILLAGGLDNATRGAALTFIPFVLADKGFNAATISALFGVIFAAGAAGKFACGWLSDRWGMLTVIIVTELTTATVLIALVFAEPWMAIPLAIVFGFALNGTSSALNVAVAHFVPPEKRARGYGTYFTAALVSSALAPLAYGFLGDLAGLVVVFIVMSAMTAAVIPVVMPVRQALMRTAIT
jgi:MFS transporter, FSR family, fosmidomycin resistance protein